MDLTSFLRHTSPAMDRVYTPAVNSPKDLEGLHYLNALGNDWGKDIYLTSRDNITSNPVWLDGAKIDTVGGAKCARTGAIIIVEKGEGVVDVFYFIFWAYNNGGIVVGQNLGMSLVLRALIHSPGGGQLKCMLTRSGNHVGDWEHVMIRFKGGKPRKVWLSQHANGEAYSFKALEKDKDGTGDRVSTSVTLSLHSTDRV